MNPLDPFEPGPSPVGDLALWLTGAVGLIIIVLGGAWLGEHLHARWIVWQNRRQR